MVYKAPSFETTSLKGCESTADNLKSGGAREAGKVILSIDFIGRVHNAISIGVTSPSEPTVDV